MDPETLAALAEFLGVEATPEAVYDALTGLIAQLDGGEDAAESEGAMAPDLASLRSALELDEEASETDVITALQAMQAVLETPEPARAYDYDALHRAKRHYDTWADETPAQPDPPYRVPPSEEDDAGGGTGSPGGHGSRPGNGRSPVRRARSPFAGRHINTNNAPKPCVAHAVLAALGVRPPGFRSDARLRDIRARLFQMDRAAKADSGDGPRGAWVLNQELAADILEPLTSKLVLLQAGAFQMPMDGIDTLTIRKMIGMPGAYWACLLYTSPSPRD